MSFTLTGRVLRVEQPKVIQTQKGSMTKQNLVVEYTENPMYPQQVSFEFIDKATEKLPTLQQNQMVEVSFNVRGRDYTNDRGSGNYTSLNGWNVTPVQSMSQPQAAGYNQNNGYQQQPVQQPAPQMMNENQGGGYSTTQQTPPPPPQQYQGQTQARQAPVQNQQPVQQQPAQVQPQPPQPSSQGEPEDDLPF